MANDELVAQLSERLETFLKNYKTQVANAASHVTNTFEAVCYLVFVRYYERMGYQLRPENLIENRFRFKFSTMGHPWNYSYFSVVKICEGQPEQVLFEIRHNQKIVCAWFDMTEDDPPLFAADVAVVKHYEQGAEKEDWVSNTDLITFAEVKKLVAYPMLLAQFLGIVHELKPEFLSLPDRAFPTDFWEGKHPLPTLFTSQHMTSGTQKVLASFRQRDFKLCIVHNVDVLRDWDIVNQICEQVTAIQSKD